jgi:hypothetical protein
VSVVSALLVTTLFTGFLSPMAGGLSLQQGYVEPLVGESLTEYDQVRGLGIVLWSAVVLSAGFIPLLARFRITPGLALLSVSILGLPPLILTENSTTSGGDMFGAAPVSGGAEPIFYGFVAAGITLEVCRFLFGRPVLGRLAAAATGALVPSVLWAVAFWALEADSRMVWTPALRWGAVLLAAMIGAATAGLATLRIELPDEAEGHEP